MRNKERRLRNTKLLLEKYRLFKINKELTIKDLELYEHIVYDPDDLSLKSVMISKAKTIKMLDYLDKALEEYRLACMQKTNGEERWELLYRVYIHPTARTVKQAARSLSIPKTTAYRYIDMMVEELSSILWGMDGVELF